MTSKVCVALVLSPLVWVAPLLADAPDLPRLVAALGDDRPEAVEDAERNLLLAGPEALPVLRKDVEAQIARLDSLASRVADLVRDLDADDAATREEAERGLIDAGAPALPALREAVKKGSAEAKSRAKRAIGAIRTGKGPALARLARLAEAIGAQADDACVPDLLSLAGRLSAEDSSPAIDGLWRLGTPAAKAALQTLAGPGAPSGPGSPADVGRRWSARAALLDLGETPPGKLDDFLKDWPPAPLRMRVARALQLSELPGVVPLAMAAWGKEEDEKASQAFYNLLLGCADDEALTTCALGALASLPAEKRYALPCLLRRRTPESEKALRALLRDPDEPTREAAAAQLLPLLGDDALQDLLALLKDPAEGMASKALQSLDALVGRDPAPFLAALKDRQAYDALLPAVVRSEGADEARRIPERWGSLSKEDLAVLERLAKPFIIPALSQRLSYNDPMLGFAGTPTVLNAAIHVLAGSPPPDPRVQVSPNSQFADPYRRLLSLSPAERRESLRAPLREASHDTQLGAVRAAILLDVDGLEEEVLPLLSFEVKGGPDDELQQAARGYLSGRKTPALLDRVRKLAEGDSPGGAAGLWIDWEGRPAVEALLQRLKGKKPQYGILEALKEAPLRPEDAEVLLEAKVDTAWQYEPPRWTAALMRTGSPVALKKAAELAVSASRSNWGAPEAYTLLLREARPLALRLARASMKPAQEYPVAAWANSFADVPCPEAAEILVRTLDAGPYSPESYAKALVRDAPARAREFAAARRSSRHIARRMEALWVDLLLGERPTAEEVEPVVHYQFPTCDAAMRVLAVFAEPRDLYPLLPVLAYPVPGIRRAAFGLLEVATAHSLPEMRNDLFIPSEARKAWKAWLDAHAEAKRSELLEQALRDAGYGAGREARIRACAEGPWYLAGAAMLAEGKPYLWYSFDYCQSVAVSLKTARGSK